MLQPHSPSPSLSELPTMAGYLDSYDHASTMSPSISGDQDYSLSPNVIEFSFHNPSCKMSSAPCIADELFLVGRLLPSDAEKPKYLKAPQEIDMPRKARQRWYWLVFGFVRAPLTEMEVRDIKRRVNRKLVNPVSETRNNSVGWRLIRSLSCSAVETVAVAATVHMGMV